MVFLNLFANKSIEKEKYAHTSSATTNGHTFRIFIIIDFSVPFMQLLTNPLDGLDGNSNYGMMSGMGRPTNGVEVKSSTPGTFYVTGSPSRSSSTSPPQSDISDISSILQFIASTGEPSYTTVSPTGSFASNNGGIYSMANQYLYQQGPVQYQQQQQQPQNQPEAPKKLQRPKSANVPLTKDVVRDLQQQASKFLEEQCQQYIQQQSQDHCLQQHLQRQQQLQQQQHELEQQLRQHQNLFIGSHHQDPFIPSHFFGGSLFQQPQQQQHPQQPAVPQQAHAQSGNNNTAVKPNFQFSSSQGQQNQAYQGSAQTYQSLPPYTSVPNVTSLNQGTVAKVPSGTPSQSAQSSGNTSPSYIAIPPPLPMPPQGFTLNPVGNGRPALQRQSSGGHSTLKSKPQQCVQPQLKVKPLAGETQAPQQVVTNKQAQQIPQKQKQQDQQKEYPPPPKYPGVVANKAPQTASQQPMISGEQQQRELRRSFEMLERMQNLTLSQPDLTKLLERQTDVPKLLALSKTDLDLPLRPQSTATTPSGSPQQQEIPTEEIQSSPPQVLIHQHPQVHYEQHQQPIQQTQQPVNMLTDFSAQR